MDGVLACRNPMDGREQFETEGRFESLDESRDPLKSSTRDIVIIEKCLCVSHGPWDKVQFLVWLISTVAVS
jgi:hypothetical protein